MSDALVSKALDEKDLVDLGGIEPKQKKYRIDGQIYILLEADGWAACANRNNILANAKLASGAMVGFGEVANGVPKILAMRLFKLVTEGNETKMVSVPEDVIGSWPARMQNTLWKDFKDISDLSDPDEAKDKAKNWQSSTKDG